MVGEPAGAALRAVMWGVSCRGPIQLREVLSRDGEASFGGKGGFGEVQHDPVVSSACGAKA